MTVHPIVHVVDDDAEFRESVTRLLRLSGYDACQYESGDRFLEELTAETQGCVLLDLDMPRVSGLQLQERIGKMDSPLPIVFLSGRGDVRNSVKAMKAGAEDFLCKPASRKELIDAVERAIRRGQKSRENHTVCADLRERIKLLSPRERQVYALVVAGKQNKQIAHELSTTQRTVKAHRHKVMHKLNVRSIVELVSFADRLSALSLSEQPVTPVALAR